VNVREKALYHQIHPIKLFTDVSTSLFSLYFLWVNNLAYGLAIGIIPSVAVSAVLLRFADLKKYRASGFGNYVGRYMTNNMQMVRAFGQVIVWFGAWYHAVPLVLLGFLIILFGWIRGRLFP